MIYNIFQRSTKVFQILNNEEDVKQYRVEFNILKNQKIFDKKEEIVL